MKITICGSMHHLADMEKTEKALVKLGYEVETPNFREGEIDYNTLPDSERGKLKESLIKEHLERINGSDAILVLNEDKKGIKGYIGGNTLMEMAFAYQQGIEIFLFKPIPDMSYTDELLGMQPIILNGDISAIDTYFKNLPKTYVSSKSPIKLSAVSRGMRRAGIRTHIFAHPAQSNVNEQPTNIDETYTGAQNRHSILRSEVTHKNPDYLATVESGTHPIHPNHNMFSSTVVILEKIGFPPKVGMNTELELPKAMTDQVPSVYPDLGVLAQKEHGSKTKDPFPAFTNGQITRLKLVEDAIFNLAVQIESTQ